MITKFSQLSIYLSLRIVSSLFGIKYGLTDLWHKDETIIIIANHSTTWDFLLAPAVFDLKTFYKITPFTYMTANYFMKIPLLSAWLRLNGSFPAKPLKHYAYGLDAARHHLKSGRSVVIFPEGTRVRSDQPVRIRSGARVLAQELNISLLPVYLHFSTKTRFPWRKVTVVAGSPFKIGNMTNEQMMDHVWRLKDAVPDNRL